MGPFAIQFEIGVDKKITIAECGNDILPLWFVEKINN